MDDPKRMRQIPKMDQLMAQETGRLTDIRKPCRLQGLLQTRYGRILEKTREIFLKRSVPY